jgi:hypothetical protein
MTVRRRWSAIRSRKWTTLQGFLDDRNVGRKNRSPLFLALLKEAPLSVVDDVELSGGRANLVILLAPEKASQINQPVRFNRQELNEILSLYGRMVADGEWRDYAIDHMKDKAVFSVFRRSSEMPLYRIEKQPKLARRQGAYAVISTTGLILKRGHELRNVLRVFDRKVRLVVA